MKYGDLPIQLGTYNIQCKEMLFYQYLPIKLIGQLGIKYEIRLKCFEKLIDNICRDYINKFGFEMFKNSYVYLTAKYMYQIPNCSFNRNGYHSDGFLTDDVNYIWSDCHPTIFNSSDFNLTLADSISLKEMDEQALPENEIAFDNNTLLRLNQYNIHKVAEINTPSMRTFVKVSFSKDKYDLIGNAHNYLLDYNWTLTTRKTERNIPQSEINIK